MKGSIRSLAVLVSVLPCFVLPLSALAAQEVPVDALWFAGQGESARGGTSRVVVGVEANPRKSIRVGFYEEVAGGSGAMWRASGWMAAVLSSTMLGVDLSEYRISFDVGGRIDGPSAGGLLTTALMAAFLGDTVRAEATMTGIINPDGTIGPVGGIPHKIEGAAKLGKKLVLVPYGQRFDMDLKLKQAVDLVERGRAVGVEVREVRDISEAYASLTGKPLPLPKPAQDLPPEVPPAALAKVRDRTQALIGRYQAFASQVKAAGQLNPEYQQTMAQGERAHALAIQAFTQGLFAVAYDRMVTANLMAEAVLLGITLNRVGQQGGEPALRDLLERLKQVAGKFDALVKRLDKENPRTLADAAAVAEAYGMATQAGGSVLLGQEREQEMAFLMKQAAEQGGQKPAPAAPAKGVERIGRKLYEAAFFYRMADLLLDLAEDRLIVGKGMGGTPTPPAEVVGKSAKLLHTSADAVMSYLDGVVLQGQATQAGVSLETFRSAFMAQDPEYALAYATYLALGILSISESPYARLGPSMMLYAGAGSLMAKYYSLGAEVGEFGTVKSVRMEKALVNMLDLAFKNARDSINLAKQSGVEPVLAALYYQAATFLREDDLDAKLTALTYLWQATSQARVLAFLAGGLRRGQSLPGPPGQPSRTEAPAPPMPATRTPGR